ncbi:nicotinamidase-related amidase [Altererythrobacter atlanticus]|uniref:Peroxyureidoacrylate/ureidoacrylate amidohydrolase RutB n=1 Tax=Croceibacterium atlanticum TaxID=1267766 RepID=A0A0F7KNI2_9SPHN|nr:isochorismatase family cysteine hydrolase [Croceibacterium atlanticum]AKH41129.1 Peroxyureidoacrylate/ureidoacrylate amidohydrolase RutB [Croceibacterium atlanticum]MBB5732645.1 nicotinamidase-related amidase [Croceibacterium atlanticum]
MVEASAAQLPMVDPAGLPPMIVPERTALVVVDIQKDFAAPDGLLGRVGVDLACAEEAIDRIEELIAAARKAGATVAFMRVVTTPETDSNALKTYMARTGQPGGEAICRVADGGADYYRVSPEAGDIEIDKLMFDSFHGTDLEQQLRDRGIDTVVMTGLSTDCCVDSTARAAFHRDFHVFVVADACAAYDADLHNHTLQVLAKNCAILTNSDAVREAWSA